MNKKSIKKRKVNQVAEAKNNIKDFDFEMFGDKIVISKSKYLNEEAEEIAHKAFGEDKVLKCVDGYVSIKPGEWLWEVSEKTYGAVPVWIYGYETEDVNNITQSGTDSGGEEHGPDNV